MVKECDVPQMRWVTAFIDHPGDDASVRFWQMATGSGLSTRRGSRGQFATLLPPAGDSYLRLQSTDDESAGVHIDLHVPSPAEAVELGASIIAEERGLVILRSPAGMTFCFVTASDRQPFRPDLTRVAGCAYTFDQVSIDIPFDRFDAECDFWSALTGWPLHGGSVPEFRVLARPEGFALRFLLQRLGTDDPSATARAHLDAAVGSDGEAIAAWHETIGAEIVSRGRRWITLLDPAGLPYCLTERDPITGSLPPSP